jgi:hypothetical protein
MCCVIKGQGSGRCAPPARCGAAVPRSFSSDHPEHGEKDVSVNGRLNVAQACTARTHALDLHIVHGA